MLASRFARSRAWKRLQRIFGNWQVTGSQKRRSSSMEDPSALTILHRDEKAFFSVSRTISAG